MERVGLFEWGCLSVRQLRETVLRHLTYAVWTAEQHVRWLALATRHQTLLMAAAVQLCGTALVLAFHFGC